jgi:hypothetical protein
MLVHTRITEEYEDEEDAKVEVVYTPPNSLSQLVDGNKPFWSVGCSQQLFTHHCAKLKLNLHMCICDELLNPGPSWHAPIKNVNMHQLS